MPNRDLSPPLNAFRKVSDTLPHTDDISLIRLSSLTIAIMMYVAYYLGRVGLGETPNILPLLLSVTILLLPGIVHVKHGYQTALLQLSVILGFFALGWISILTEIDLTIALYAAFFVAIFLSVRGKKFQLGKWRGLKISIMVLFGFEFISLVWTQDYMNPLSPEAFAVGQRFVHLDTLFLSSLTANIKNYQVASTGLAGLVPFNYHSGSNYLFASYAQLCKVSVLQFYNLSYPVIFIPLFFQTLLLATYSNVKSKSQDLRLVTGFVLLFFLLSGIVPSRIGFNFLLPTALNSHIISQSYCISLILTFLAISVYSPLLGRKFIHPDRTINAFLILCIPLWIFLIGYTKVSTAVVMFSVLMYLLTRRGLIFQWWTFLSACLGAASLYYVLHLTIESTENTFLIQWGSYYNMYVKGNLVVYFLLHYLFFIVLLALYLRITRRKRNGLFNDFVSERYLVIELIVVAACVGILPGLLIHIEGGSALYFSDIQYWLTAIALIHVTPYFVFRNYKRRVDYRKPMIAIGFILAVIIVRESFFRSFYYYAKKNLQIRTALAYGAESTFKELRKTEPLGRLVKTITLGIRKSPLYSEQVTKLNIPLFASLRDLPQAVKSNAVIYCEDLQQLESFLTCAEATFFIGAMGESALINGLYWAGECYTIGAYGMRAYPAVAREMTKEDAAKIARDRNFQYLIVLSLEKGSHTVEKL